MTRYQQISLNQKKKKKLQQILSKFEDEKFGFTKTWFHLGKFDKGIATTFKKGSGVLYLWNVMINDKSWKQETASGLGCNSWISKQLQKQVLMMEIDATLSKNELDYNAQKLILKVKYGNVLENITGHIGTQKYLCTITWKRPTYMDEQE
jgi:hypothetical protein